MFQVPDHLGPRGAAVSLRQEALPPHSGHRELQGLHQDQEHRALRQRHLHLHGWVSRGTNPSFYRFLSTEKSAQNIVHSGYFLRFLGSIQYAMKLEKYLSWLKYSSGDWMYFWPVAGSESLLSERGLSKTWQLSCLLCDCQRLPSTTCHSCST